MFIIKRIKYLSCMFSRCSSLKEINLNNFDMGKVKYMNHMFFECTSLIEINLNINTNNNIDFYRMFYGCSNELITKIKNKYKILREKAFKE